MFTRGTKNIRKMKKQHFNREKRDMQVKKNDAITVSGTSRDLQKDNFTHGLTHN